jgi:hypothetical protein
VATYRELAELLLAGLPPRVWEIVGIVLAGPRSDGGDNYNAQYRLETLRRLPGPDLDTEVDGLILVNEHGSLRGINPDTPESRLVAPSAECGLLDVQEAKTHFSVWEAAEKLKDLLEKGKSNESIIVELDLEHMPEVVEALEEYRRRSQGEAE